MFYVAIPNQIILHTCYSSNSYQIIQYTRAIFTVPCVKPNQIYKCSKSSQSIKWKNYYISTIITLIYNAYHNQTRDRMAYMTYYCLHYLHLKGGAEVAPCRLCTLNYSMNMFCGNTKPNNSTHVLFFTLWLRMEMPNQTPQHPRIYSSIIQIKFAQTVSGCWRNPLRY